MLSNSRIGTAFYTTERLGQTSLSGFELSTTERQGQTSLRGIELSTTERRDQTSLSGLGYSISASQVLRIIVGQHAVLDGFCCALYIVGEPNKFGLYAPLFVR